MIDEHDAPDRGADGPAMLARPHAMREVGAEYRGSVAKGEIVEVRAYQDATVFDDLVRRGLIASREHAVAERLAGWFHAAGLVARQSTRYGHREPAGGEEGEIEDIAPIDAYRAALRLLTATEAHVVDSMLTGSWRGWMATTLSQALRRLADEWGLP